MDGFAISRSSAMRGSLAWCRSATWSSTDLPSANMNTRRIYHDRLSQPYTSLCGHKIIAFPEVGGLHLIATNVAPRDVLWRPNRRTRFGVGGRSFFTTVSLGCNGVQNPCMVPRSQQRPMFYSTNQKSSVAIFIGKPIPRPDRFLSKDCRSPKTTTWSRHSRRIDAMAERTYGTADRLPERGADIWQNTGGPHPKGRRRSSAIMPRASPQWISS